jgi:uncharacterized protein YxjI
MTKWIKFQMREDLFSIGDDFWIEDDAGKKVFKVDNKKLRMRETFILEDMSGREVATIREKMLTVRDKMTIDRDGQDAVVHKNLIGIRDRYHVEVDGGQDLKAKGNFVDHEYKVERDGKKVAEVSKKWFRIRETYGVEIDPEQDVALILAVTVCIDALAGDRD